MTLGQYFKESAEDRRCAFYQLEDVFILLEVEQLRKNYKFKITCNGFTFGWKNSSKVKVEDVLEQTLNVKTPNRVSQQSQGVLLKLYNYTMLNQNNN